MSVLILISRRTLALTAVIVLVGSSISAAQTGVNLDELSTRAMQLIRQQKMTEALPLLEQLVAAKPSEPGLQFYLGFALNGAAGNASENALRQALRIRSRNAFLKARELGSKEPGLDALITSIPEDGADPPKFTANKNAETAMETAEKLFSQGQVEEALFYYKKALSLEPKLYEAALSIGDTYTQQENYTEAARWYQKAVQINPDRETAYRYSAKPFMRQKKFAEALPFYIDAYISEPYSKYANTGLQQWATATKSNLSRPHIDIPVKVNVDASGSMTAVVDPQTASSKDDGSSAWSVYAHTRLSWQKELFAKTFPDERNYRHSLAEESAALHALLAAVADSKIKKTNPSIAFLQKLDKEGLIEAYVVMGLADEGIAKDQVEYLHKNREKLRQYVSHYVVNSGK